MTVCQCLNAANTLQPKMHGSTALKQLFNTVRGAERTWRNMERSADAMEQGKDSATAFTVDTTPSYGLAHQLKQCIRVWCLEPAQSNLLTATGGCLYGGVIALPIAHSLCIWEIHWKPADLPGQKRIQRPGREYSESSYLKSRTQMSSQSSIWVYVFNFLL